ncbi:Heat shock protein HtpX [Candidatus Magnetoovum chiemensis]|nr:Heat shock protein HtpX [Candidatus Magnetoovum chiemensis]
MWELIRSNQRKSLILFILMGLILLSLGAVFGAMYNQQNGYIAGITISFAVWIIWSLIGYYKGDTIILALSRAKEVTRDAHPQLFNVVEEMKIAANMPYMPRIYIMAEEAPNAFATGRNPQKSAITVTAGLLSQLNRNELQGVVAHEMGHILNRDILFMTFAGIMLGTIVFLSEIGLRSFMHTSTSSRRYSSKESKGSGAIIIVLAVVLAILAPILARLLYFAISRKREYLADATAVRLTRYPEGLASALEKISGSALKLQSANSVTAPMYIINPLKMQAKANAAGLFSTHPPISERVKILRKIQGGSYKDYQKAFSQITGNAIMPLSALNDTAKIELKQPQLEPQQPIEQAKHQKRQLNDLMRTVNNFIFLKCLCGLKIKVPPDLNKPHINCPRCNRQLNISEGRHG